MKTALARLFTNIEPAISKLGTLSAGSMPVPPVRHNA